jgi:hypothetical protein
MLRDFRAEKQGECVRIDRAIEAITNSHNHSPRRFRGTGIGIALPGTTPRTKRQLSPAGRKALRDAMRARWAKAKKSGQNSLG